jgi:glycosyltransferase involved in cell wall biosynthesis
MSCGAVVVASRTPPVTEVIQDQENGLLFDFFDRRGLSDQVVRAVGRRRIAKRISTAARETVCARYDLRKVSLPEQLKFLRQATGLKL